MLQILCSFLYKNKLGVTNDTVIRMLYNVFERLVKRKKRQEGTDVSVFPSTAQCQCVKSVKIQHKYQ